MSRFLFEHPTLWCGLINPRRLQARLESILIVCGEAIHHKRIDHSGYDYFRYSQLEPTPLSNLERLTSRPTHSDPNKRRYLPVAHIRPHSQHTLTASKLCCRVVQHIRSLLASCEVWISQKCPR